MTPISGCMFLTENSQHVVSDVIDGEMMLLHLEAGNYYSLQGLAASLWDAIKVGTSQQTLLESLKTRYPGTAEGTIEDDLEAFLQSLRSEGLMIAGDEGHHQPSLAGEYQAPRLEKYTDLQDLLLIDPIHEADDAGWPVVPT